MEILNTIILFVIGFYFLIKGAQILVRGASSIAKIYGVSKWFIGVVIAGIGTSLPEFSVSVASAFAENSIGLSALIGSNIFNIFVIVGISAFFTPIIVRKEWVLDFLINIAAIIVAGCFIVFSFSEGFVGISRMEGIALAALFVLWLIFMFRHDTGDDDDGAETKVFTLFTSLVMITAGLAGVFLGGWWVVDGAETIAHALGVSNALIGLTLVAVGTSLPELVVSLVAIVRRNYGIALGNVLGSSVFDFLGVLGITALIHPLRVIESVELDIFLVLLASTALVLSLFIGRRFIISRPEGIFFLLLYGAYLVFLFLRG